MIKVFFNSCSKRTCYSVEIEFNFLFSNFMQFNRSFSERILKCKTQRWIHGLLKIAFAPVFYQCNVRRAFPSAPMCIFYYSVHRTKIKSFHLNTGSKPLFSKYFLICSKGISVETSQKAPPHAPSDFIAPLKSGKSCSLTGT